MHEQLETTDVNPGQHLHRDTAIDAGNLRGGEVQAEIEHTTRDQVGHVEVLRQRHAIDFGEPLGAQQVGDDIFRGNANTGGGIR